MKECCTDRHLSSLRQEKDVRAKDDIYREIPVNKSSQGRIL